jgi:hypothetical protein
MGNKTSSKTTNKIKCSVLACLLVAVVGLTLASAPGFAHHGYGNSYDQSKWATWTGIVTEFDWKNPHAGLYMDVKGKNGKIVHTIIEMDSPGVLNRQGWTKRLVKVGDTVTVTVHPSSAGVPIGVCYGCKVIVNGKEAPRNEPVGIGRPAASG